MLEALIFTAPRPLSTAELAEHCRSSEPAVVAALEQVLAEYAPGRHGIELTRVAGGATFRVAADCEEAVRAMAGARRPDDLSPALLETLSCVAYLQPATRAEVAQVRGVSSEWALSSLEERGLIEESGRAESPGAPILYRTTDRFLKLFGLETLSGLPALAEFALSADDVEEIRTRLLANAARRAQ